MGGNIGALGKAVYKIYDATREQPSSMCGHIDNYTSRTLVYKESRFSDGKLSAPPPRNTAPGDSVTFKARAEGQTITFELCFGFEGRQDLGVLTLGYFVVYENNKPEQVAYAAWNQTTSDAQESRRLNGAEDLDRSGIRITVDESEVGHPQWQMWKLNLPNTASWSIDRIVCNDKELRARNLYTKFQQAMDECRPIHINKSLFSGVQFDLGYIDYTCKDGPVTTLQRRSFKYGQVLDFAFRIKRIEYNGNRTNFFDNSRMTFMAFFQCRDANKGDKFIVNNDVMGGDTEPGVPKRALFRCERRLKSNSGGPAAARVVLLDNDEGKALNFPTRGDQFEDAV